jgi:hypothetical protein
MHDATLSVIGAADSSSAIGQHRLETYAASDHPRETAMGIKDRIVGIQCLDGGNLRDLLPSTGVHQRRDETFHGKFQQPVFKYSIEKCLAENIRQSIGLHARVPTQATIQRFGSQFAFIELERLAVVDNEIRACDVAARIGQQVKHAFIEGVVVEQSPAWPALDLLFPWLTGEPVRDEI